MRESDKGFVDYCKGYTLKEIASKRGVEIATVKTWMTRGIGGNKWTVAKAMCTDEETQEINFDKVRKLIKGKGNITPSKAGKQLMPAQYPKELKEDRQLVSDTLKECCMYFEMSLPKTPEEMEARIIAYFNTCISYGTIPTVEGLANALGTVTSYLWEIEQGKRGTVYANLVKKAKHMIKDFDAKLALKGKIDRTVYIFRAKNYYGMRDEVEQTITVNDPLGDKVDKNAILERLDSVSEE